MKKTLATALLLGVTCTPVLADDPTFYVGVDTVDLEVTAFGPGGADGDPTTPTTDRNEFDSSMLRLRGGWNVNEGFALEVHYGLEDDETDPANNTIAISDYIGVFAVPTADLFSFLKLEIPLGFALITVDDARDEDFESEAYGVNVRFLPAKLLGSDLPLAVSFGYMVYGQDGGDRIDGANAGIRFDFF